MCLPSIVSNCPIVATCAPGRSMAINEGNTVAWFLPAREEKGEAPSSLAGNIRALVPATKFYVHLKDMKGIVKMGRTHRYICSPRASPKIHELKFVLSYKKCDIIPIGGDGEEIDFSISIYDDSIDSQELVENRIKRIDFGLFKSVIKEIGSKENKEICLKFTKHPLEVEYYEEGNLIEVAIAPRICPDDD